MPGSSPQKRDSRRRIVRETSGGMLQTLSALDQQPLKIHTHVMSACALSALLEPKLGDHSLRHRFTTRGEIREPLLRPRTKGGDRGLDYFGHWWWYPPGNKGAGRQHRIGLRGLKHTICRGEQEPQPMPMFHLWHSGQARPSPRQTSARNCAWSNPHIPRQLRRRLWRH